MTKDEFTNVKARPILEEFKNFTVSAMQHFIATHPDITNAEVIAVFGRVTGYAIALMPPAERVEARELATKNLIEGINSVERMKQ